jgi:hypothetical protein
MRITTFISRPTLFSSAVPAQSCTEVLRGSIKRILIAAGLATALAAPAWSTELPDVVASTGAGSVPAGQDTGAVDPESVAHGKWRALMGHTSTPAEGCFHVSYPSQFWEKVDCTIGQPRAHPVHVKPTGAAADVVGSGNDWVVNAKGLIVAADGSFSSVKGVKSEKGVGVAAYGGGGILGPNEYSLQINTNANQTTSKCAGHSGCTVWQQYVYAPDYIKAGKAEVYMQYWLLGWGSSACPKGWTGYEGNCYRNSALTQAPDVPITDLSELGLFGNAEAGGKDTVIFSYGTESYSSTGNDSVLDISSVWNAAEFNIFGDAGGSRADFNSGSSITLSLSLIDGSASAPTCVANAGTTGETNNLNLGACTASAVLFPMIEFTESN